MRAPGISRPTEVCACMIAKLVGIPLRVPGLKTQIWTTKECTCTHAAHTHTFTSTYIIHTTIHCGRHIYIQRTHSARTYTFDYTNYAHDERWAHKHQVQDASYRAHHTHTNNAPKQPATRDSDLRNSLLVGVCFFFRFS